MTPLHRPPAGLTHAEAERRLAREGANQLPAPRPLGLWRRLLGQFANPLVGILLAALLLDVAMTVSGDEPGLPAEAFAIAAILLLNALLGLWQERKAERALAALRGLAAPQAWVVREGSLARVPAAALVPGDAIRVDAGERVPADGMLVTTDELVVDEAILTGESIPVAKAPGEEVLSGTLVVRGRAWATVTRTGLASTMGRIARLIGEVMPTKTPLQRRLDRFGRWVAIGVVGVAVVLVLAGIAMEGTAHLGQIALLGIALAVAAVPEGLPVAIAFALALGVERMARRKAVVRRMDAVETLGSITVVATDKTGTITENRMAVRELRATDEARALRAMVLANDADAGSEAGDPMEVALLHAARARGVDPAALQEESPRLGGRAFDSAWRFMRVTVAEPHGPVSYLKGAPEIIAARCRLTVAEREQWLAQAGAAGGDGLRAIALAAGEGEAEEGLEWLGLVLLWDPPRAEAADAVARCRQAGVRVIMVTGDHPATAASVARSVGLPDAPLFTGADLAARDEAGIAEAAATGAIFARVSAEQKLALVRALRAQGEVVAVTGDGVNDAPALKQADVGIAMGQRGSAVAREVADLVLLDDNFDTLVAAIEEGRNIFENIRKFLRFLFSTNLSEVVVVGVGFLLALGLGLQDAAGELLLPLTAAQLLWLNLVTDGAPALALSLDRTPGLMQRPPRPTGEPLLDRASGRFILLAGGLKAVLALGVVASLLLSGETDHVARTGMFLFMAVGQLLLAFPSRWSGTHQATHPALVLAVGGTLLLQAALLVLPAFRHAFETTLPAPSSAGIVAVAAIVAWAGASWITRRVHPARS